MNKRQKETLQSQLDSEAKTIRELKKVYDQALKDCEMKIRQLSSRTDMENLQSIIYQKQYQEALKGQLEGVMAQLQSNEFATVSDYLSRCYQDGFLGTMYDLQGQGIPLIIPIDQEQVVRAIQTDSKISTSLYTRLGEDVKQLKNSIRAELSRGIANGSTWNQIAGKIAAGMKTTPFDKAYNNAIRIARTEGHRISVKSASDAQHKAKKKGADVLKQWDATLDGRTRPSHRQVDGELKELDEKFSNGLEYPGDPKGKAAEVVNCRCALLQRARWALDDEELETLKERAAYHGLDKTDSFEDYKKKYLKAVEKERERSDVQKTSKSDELTNRRIQRMAAMKKKNALPVFDDMSNAQLKAFAEKNLKTKFEDFKGANADYVKETIKTISSFEQKMGGKTIDGLSVKFGGIAGKEYAKYDDKTKTILLKKTGNIEAFETAQKEENARFKYKWKTDKDYHATTSYSGTIWHELGHAVDIDTGQALSRKLSSTKELDELSVKISNYAGSSQNVRVSKRSEAWAENFAAYMEGGKNKEKVPKEIVEMIEDYFSQK